MRTNIVHIGYFIMIELNHLESINRKIEDGTVTESELGAALLELEKLDLKLFGKHFSGKSLLNRDNPHVRRLIDKAEEEGLV